jgi:putative cell wall-binding protein
VIIASGDDAAAADPLASASLSWAYDAPLLLTKKVGTPAETLAALKAMDAEAEGDLVIHVVGGPGSIPEARMAEMAAIVGDGDIERLPYGDRYETARQIALRVHEIAEDTNRDPGMAFIANGSDYGKFFDALSASAVSAHTGSPILLTTTSEVPSATLTALGEIQADDVFVVGGKGSVPDSAMTKVDATARLAGKDRYETSVILAKFGGQYGWLSYTQVGLAAAMPDGMTGGAAMGLLGGPMLITRADSLPSVTYKFIDDNDQLIERAVIFGGSASVGGSVTQAVKQALKQ